MKFFSLMALILFSSLISLKCSGQIKGDFGWSSTDDREIVEPEKSLLIERSYRLGRQNLYFYNYETIWWVYQINEGSSGSHELFTAALFENNNSPTPVEVDMRESYSEWDGGKQFIRHHYDPLPEGRYLLKLAVQTGTIDQIQFMVIPPEGPGAMGSGPVSEESDNNETDEILKYSS